MGFLGGGGGGVGTEGVLGDEWSQHFIKLYYNYTLVFELSGNEVFGPFLEDTICSESSLPVSLFLYLSLSFIRWVARAKEKRREKGGEMS